METNARRFLNAAILGLGIFGTAVFCSCVQLVAGGGPLNTVQVPMVDVAGGTFSNGTADMTVSSFSIGKYEITQSQYANVMGKLPDACASGHGLGDEYPAYGVTWYEALAFCNALSVRGGYNAVYTIEGATVLADYTKNGYRLPTEAEWRFAARGGSIGADRTYSGSDAIAEVAWYDGNSGGTCHPVVDKAANELGLHDMSGNVWEFCWDWHAPYPEGLVFDYPGPSSGTFRVIRGGAWNSGTANCAVSVRSRLSPGEGNATVGFRVVRH